MNCRICGATVVISPFAAKGYTFSACSTCNSYCVNERPTEAELEAIYSDGYFTHNKYADTRTLHREYKRRVDLVKSYVKSPVPSVLEFGCATGDFIEFAKNEFDLWGFDWSTNAICEAKKRLPTHGDRLFARRLDELARLDPLFDGVLMWDVLEHIWDPVETLEILLRMIKPRGYLIASTPDVGSLAAKLLGRYWHFLTPPEHLTFFSGKTFDVLGASRLDFSVLFSTSQGKWANVGFLIYKLRRIFPGLVPAALVDFFRQGVLAQWSVYAPTGDIRYVVLQKNH